MCGSFQFGYQVGVLTGPSNMMQTFYNASNEERRSVFLSDTAVLWLWSTTVSIFCIGGAAGAFTAGYLADTLGRKGATLLVNVFSILGGLLMGLSYVANNYEMIIIGRLVIGYYAGVSVTIVPLYSLRCSLNLRGAIGTIHQLMITVGILVAQALGLFAFDYEKGWPILLSLTAGPSIIQLFLLPFCPESPRWLFVNRDKEDACREALVKFRGTEDVDKEMNEIRRENMESMNTEKVGILAVLRRDNPDWTRPLIICTCLHLGQQFSGINAIMFYATEIYYQTGMDDTQVAYSTVGTGAINVLMTIVAVFVVDRAGRKALLLIPFAGMVVATALLTMSLNLQEQSEGWKWVSLILIYIYIIAFAIGPGPIPYVIVPELWAQGPRPAAMSISVQVNWYSNFIVGLTFPFLQDTIGAYAFLFFMFFCLLTTIFVFFYVPETKGRTFEDIVGSFGASRPTEDDAKINKAYSP
ncbi:putative solute carrier family 2, facilitated glucose transporter member 1-like [Apostichopus japonicus]|uniref:Putative solute carrier family 2, facilitated glucose transporter member 1-like n=1 Tax=Stichopus japonicus TaxID=307972 RepID=A0A2G8LLJ6_STIJA|nr:putative solute carrier family 2, facilitated glucose transporter member 1-like [Apostichopus japonicus]